MKVHLSDMRPSTSCVRNKIPVLVDWNNALLSLSSDSATGFMNFESLFWRADVGQSMVDSDQRDLDSDSCCAMKFPE